jgi:hypothetical protein
MKTKLNYRNAAKLYHKVAKREKRCGHLGIAATIEGFACHFEIMAISDSERLIEVNFAN